MYTSQPLTLSIPSHVQFLRLEALVDEMEKTCTDPTQHVVFISHGDCVEDAQYVERLVRQRLNVRDVKINYVDPVIGAHSGPGTIALFFLGSQR